MGHPPSGVDYDLGTIGMCLGPPPLGGPPSDQKKKIPMTTVKKMEEKMTRIGVLLAVLYFL